MSVIYFCNYFVFSRFVKTVYIFKISVRIFIFNPQIRIKIIAKITFNLSIWKAHFNFKSIFFMLIKLYCSRLYV